MKNPFSPQVDLNAEQVIEADGSRKIIHHWPGRSLVRMYRDIDLAEGHRPPWYYRRAYFNPMWKGTAFAIIPFNLLFRVLDWHYRQNLKFIRFMTQ